MATVVIMPRQGQSVESCVITSWNKKLGDTVNVGDTLFSYETDKSAFDEPATVSGKILAVFAEEGDDVECLLPVCIIGEDGEDISALMPKEGEKETPKAEETPKVEEKVEENVKEAPKAEEAKATENNSGFLKISPRARILAERTDADVSRAIPTGPNGRIIERDIEAALDKGYVLGAAAEVTENEDMFGGAEYIDEKLSNVRKVIAKSMHASLSSMAQLTLNTSFDATDILALRAKIKANGERLGLPNITLNDMVMYAVAKTVKNHKSLNAHYLDDSMRFFKNVNLGMAVDTDRGLMVPTLAKADTLKLSDFAAQSKKLIADTKAGTIAPDKLRGASFTVTNLGSFGIESFTPVINPPQTGILGICGTERKIKEVDGKDVFYTAMGLSLTFDHRALDGAPAAKFLKELCANLEAFSLLLME